MNQLNENGEYHGYWEYFHDKQTQKNIHCRGNYINGKLNGLWENYYYNGNLYTIGSYKNGKVHGYWQCYDYIGDLKEKRFHL